jgi:uroporphyrinogen-III synthase
MQVLVTRPRPDADETARRLAAAGHEPVIAPLLDVVFEPDAVLDLDGVQGFLVTSANGARALGAATARRDLSVHAVGDASAAAARAQGFEEVTAAGGDVGTLAAQVTGICTPGAGPLVHVAGTVTAGDLAGELAGSGFDVRRAVLYRADAAETLPDTAVAALRDGSLGAVLLFSPRTAAAFAQLVRTAGVSEGCAGATACCLSRAVANAVRELPFREVRVAAHPDQDSLLACLPDASSQGDTRTSS